MKNTKINCILLVDDNQADNFFHDMVLTEADFAEHIIARESALEALEYLEHQEKPQPDLIFLDINMPRIDGWQFLERYRELFPKATDRAPVYMLTTAISAVDEKRATATKMVAGFLTKPLDAEAMKTIELNLFNSSKFGITTH